MEDKEAHIAGYAVQAEKRACQEKGSEAAERLLTGFELCDLSANWEKKNIFIFLYIFIVLCRCVRLITCASRRRTSMHQLSLSKNKNGGTVDMLSEWETSQ